MTAAARQPRQLWWAGAAAVVLYVVVAALTGGRPLFDGFAPPAPYRWVNPPPELAAGNQPPEPAERNVPLTGEGNEATNASTSDAQIIVTLPTAAVAGHPPDTTILLRLAPGDAAALGPLPSGLRALSNAYQVTLTYQPSGTPVTEIKPGPAIAMTAESHGSKLLFSPDGQAWEETSARPFGTTTGLTGPFRGPGYYVIGGTPPVAVTTTTPRGGSGGAAGVGIGVVAAIAIAAAGLTLRSRRRQRREESARKARAVAQARARTKGKAPPKAKAPPPRKKPKRR